MNEFDEIVLGRNANSEQILDARAIAQEINFAWASQDSELGKYQSMGYMAAIGNPENWWYEHCENYRNASDKYPTGRALQTVCLLADALLRTS